MASHADDATAVHCVDHMLNRHYFDLLWICCTTYCTINSQQIEAIGERKCADTIGTVLAS